MKMPSVKQTFLTIFACSAVTAICLGLAAAGIKLLPGAISYSVNAEKSFDDTAAVSEDNPIDCKYSKASQIEENGPYLIKSEGEEIYVFSGNIRLYRVKATCSDLPLSDKSSVNDGFILEDRAFLTEFIEYMES